MRAITDGFAKLGIPLSAVHLDIDYMRGFRVFTVDPDRFPDLGRLTADAAATGARLVTIVDAGVKIDPDYDVYREGRDQHRFCTDAHGHLAEGVVWPGRSAFPDFTDPGTRSWWAGKYRTLTDAGVAGIWHDMNEPTSIALLGDPTLPTSTRHHFDGRGGDHAEGHNLYGLLMNRAGYEGLRERRPERRPFIVSRSGWAGMQRWAWNWTGDVASTWESMRQQMATVVGLGLSGVPYSGSDIGGFSGVPDDELYLRWLQMSVFMPYCRTHSVRGVPPREPWCFGEPTRRIVAAWIRFRYRLLPVPLHAGPPGVGDRCPADPAPVVAGPRYRLMPTSPRLTTPVLDVDDAFLLGDAPAGGARRRARGPPAGRGASPRAVGAVCGADEADAEGRPARRGPAGADPRAGPGRIGRPARRRLGRRGRARATSTATPTPRRDGPGGRAAAPRPRPAAPRLSLLARRRGRGLGRVHRRRRRRRRPRPARRGARGGSASRAPRRRWTWERARVTSRRRRWCGWCCTGSAPQRAVADGVEVAVSGRRVECAPFSELTLRGVASRRPHSGSEEPASCDAGPDATEEPVAACVAPEEVEHDGVVLRRLTVDDAAALSRAATESLEHLAALDAVGDTGGDLVRDPARAAARPRHHVELGERVRVRDLPPRRHAGGRLRPAPPHRAQRPGDRVLGARRPHPPRHRHRVPPAR